MAGSERLESIGCGGRYDALASDGRTTYPGVGISFGVCRLLVPLLTDGVARRQPLGAQRRPGRARRRGVPRRQRRRSPTPLRARGIPCEVAASPQKFGKQIRYAERRGIPFVWFTSAEAATR